jgi:hypothetical protein
MMIGEFGSVENATPDEEENRAGWFTNVLTEQVPHNYPQIRAILYYHHKDGYYDWTFDTTASASSWARGITQPFYTSNTYGSYMTSPIPAP